MRYSEKVKQEIPQEVLAVAHSLEEAGFKAYLVGGCVRDLLLERYPKDWDIATNAKPEEVQKIFPESVYENEFGTVLVKIPFEDRRSKLDENPSNPEPRTSNVVEVTTFRAEGKYTDKRHPDEVRFAKTIEEDLSRRDFTVNAMALSLVARNMKREAQEKSYTLHATSYTIIDPYGGQDDLKNRIIRTVGNPEERFNEDALRLMRAVRFAVELDFEIEASTRRAIEKLAGGLESIAKERIRDEFIKIIMSSRAARGIILLEELDLLRYVLPELREGLGIGQNKHHIYSVFEHNVRALEYSAGESHSLIVRLAALLHDVGKPKTKRGEGPDSTFYNHAQVGAKLALRALERLHFSTDVIEQVAHLVRHHMFYYNVGEVTDAGVRRFLRRVGPEYVDDLLKLREADRIGSGVPKAVPYKLRHFLFMMEKVKRDPLSPAMLKVSGEDVMRLANIPPSPRVGWIIAALMDEVLDDPIKNEREKLEERIKDLGKKTDAELKMLAEKGKEKTASIETDIVDEIKKKYYVS